MKIDDKARILQEVCNQLGWKENILKIIERVNQLDKGLVKEDEFIYVLNWSGNCELIHKLDQLQLPREAKSRYTIPDIFVEVKTENGNKKFLIEIKTSKKEKLSWTEKYYQGLLNYSNLIGIPILIAWKWNKFGIWSLFDINQFSKPSKNYKITFNKAQQENLMSKYFGDYIIKPSEDFGLNISMKKVKKISENKNESGDIEASWETVVDEVYFSGEENKKIEGFNKAVFALLMSMQTEEKITETASHIIIKYFPYPNKMQFSQCVPIRLIEALSDVDINWLQCAKEESYPIEYRKFYKGLENGIEEGTIRYIFHLKPKCEK